MRGSGKKKARAATRPKPDGIPMIPFVRIGRSIRYCKSDLLAIVQTGRHGDAA